MGKNPIIAFLSAIIIVLVGVIAHLWVKRCCLEATELAKINKELRFRISQYDDK